MTWKVVRIVLRVLGVAAVLLALVAVRVMREGERELATGERMLEHADRAGAVIHLRRAARWYAPGARHPRRALSLLLRIAADHERAERNDDALFAYRAVRSAVESTRSFYTPNADLLERADDRIADLMARQSPSPIDAERSFEQRRDLFRSELRASTRADPSPLWTAVLLGGFGLWVGSAFAFSSRAIDADDRLVPRQARLWSALFVLGFALWILGMSLA